MASSVAIVTALLPTVASVAAEPTTVAQAQAQIDQLNNQAEIASEQYNGAQASLAQADVLVGATTDATTRAQAVVIDEQSKVSALAVEAYEAGGLNQGLAVMLDNTSPVSAITRVAILQQLSAQQSTTLNAVRSADLNYQQAMTSAGQARATAAALTTTLNQKQAQITSALTQSAQVLSRLSAAQRAALLAAQQAQLAADQARAAIVVANYKKQQVVTANRRVAREAAVAQEAAAQAASARAIGSAVFATLPQSAGGSSAARSAVAAAMSKLGARYVFGAGGPRVFDCSGLVQWAYAQVGIHTAHYTGTFWNSYRHIGYNQLEPGDLVFFYRDHHHVGIYIGGGMMINAPHTGDVVRIVSVLGHGQYSGAVRIAG